MFLHGLASYDSNGQLYASQACKALPKPVDKLGIELLCIHLSKPATVALPEYDDVTNLRSNFGDLGDVSV